MLSSVRLASGKVVFRTNHRFEYARRLALLEAEDGMPIKLLPAYDDKIPNYHPGETGAGIKSLVLPPARVPWTSSVSEHDLLADP